MRTHSSEGQVSVVDKVKYSLQLARMQGARRRSINFTWLMECWDEYEGLCQELCGKSLRDSRLIEVGYGARPFRLMFFRALGVDVSGVDLDAPLLTGSLSEVTMLLRRNGAQRTLKSVARWLIVQRKEYQALVEFCNSHPHRAREWNLEQLYLDVRPRLAVADAAASQFWDGVSGKADLVYSEDVFEHIPRASIPAVLRSIANNVTRRSVVVIRPNVFTGITGGHLLEWYPHTLSIQRPRRSEPWEHLRKDRFPADTYLNRLRLADYRTLFGECFEILEEKNSSPRLGEEFIDEGVEKLFEVYGREELFANNVLFVLRKR